MSSQMAQSEKDKVYKVVMYLHGTESETEKKLQEEVVQIVDRVSHAHIVVGQREHVTGSGTIVEYVTKIDQKEVLVPIIVTKMIQKDNVTVECDKYGVTIKMVQKNRKKKNIVTIIFVE